MRNHIHTPPPNKLKLILISIAIAVIGGILLMGIPGALMVVLANALFNVFALNPLQNLGEGTWPLAIMVSLLWPITITPLYIFHFKRFQQHSKLRRWLFCLLGSFMFGVVLSVLFLMSQV